MVKISVKQEKKLDKAGKKQNADLKAESKDAKKEKTETVLKGINETERELLSVR
ncbi:hypothetical protein [Dyadobacter alkalitolerans]|uniref:hypothetical protein n=1 Tax=Dyadobacter alkalitolerans TaxID=492736 RepID=UPI000400CD94|nr:hypothetical protein [Dyadobacter alkalitolerans]